MKRITLCLPLLFTLACDSGEDPVENRSEEETKQFADERHGPHGKEHGQKMVDRLCEEIECTDDQREGIGDLLAKAKHDRGPDGDEREARHQALADAFRAETFTLPAQPGPDAERHDAHKAEMAAMIVGVHQLLTPEQRETIASKIETEGPKAFMGGRHGKHHGFHGKGEFDQAEFDPAKKAEHKVERLCELVTCTEAQAEQLGTIFTDALAGFAPPEPPEDADAKQAEFASAFRAETLAVADVEAMLAEMKPPKHRPELGELMVAVHAVLTPEQRGILADKIEEHGPHALMGGKGHRGKHGKKGKKGKKAEFDSNEPV